MEPASTDVNTNVMLFVIISYFRGFTLTARFLKGKQGDKVFYKNYEDPTVLRENSMFWHGSLKRTNNCTSPNMYAGHPAWCDWTMLTLPQKGFECFTRETQFKLIFNDMKLHHESRAAQFNYENLPTKLLTSFSQNSQPKGMEQEVLYYKTVGQDTNEGLSEVS